jgi:hypothetical protein
LAATPVQIVHVITCVNNTPDVTAGRREEDTKGTGKGHGLDEFKSRENVRKVPLPNKCKSIV